MAGALLDGAADDRDRARLRASQQEFSGAWLQALPLSAIGLKMSNEVVRVAVSVRQGANLNRTLATATS